MQLIFIHGSGGSKESWFYQTQYFKGSIALDLPGHPQGELCPTIDGSVKWLRAFVQDKGYRNLVLVGHSLGGGIALLYALTYPEDVKGIITVGSGARLRVHPKTLDALEKAIQDPTTYENTPKPAFDLIAPDLAAVLKHRSAENGPAAALNDMKACDQFDIMDRIDQINIPTLALCGDQDTMTPPKYSHYLAGRMPKAKALIIEGGTHMVFAEKPLEVNRAIDDFLVSAIDISVEAASPAIQTHLSKEGGYMIRDLVIKNRSYRRFDESFVISKEILRELVDLARQTASAANKQPLKYFLSCDRQMNAIIFESLAWAAYLPEWPGPSEGERPSAYILMLGDKDISASYDYDNGIAAQTILLGAVEKGLGGCMLANVQRVKLRQKLNIPVKYEILLVIALGKPVETVIIESVKADGDIKYWHDSEGRHHVPKRTLDEVITN